MSVPWREKINDALNRSAACVAVIGLRWADSKNLPRLEDQNDPLRYELLKALADDEVTSISR